MRQLKLITLGVFVPLFDNLTGLYTTISEEGNADAVSIIPFTFSFCLSGALYVLSRTTVGTYLDNMKICIIQDFKNLTEDKAFLRFEDFVEE